MIIIWRDVRHRLRLFWREIRLVFVPCAALSCLLVWTVDYANGFYYFIGFLISFGVAFGLMFRRPEKKKEYQGDA